MLLNADSLRDKPESEMSYNDIHKVFAFILLATATVEVCGCQHEKSIFKTKSIDRYSLVTRHNPTNNHIDALTPLSVGNGSFTFTADITGLQSFPDFYETGIPLSTQSYWGWHTSPNPNKIPHQIPDVVSVMRDNYPFFRVESAFFAPLGNIRKR